MDLNRFSYPSRRTVVFAKNGMAATSIPQAAEAGIEIMRKGGNAIDAIIAMAMCIAVVEPTSNGIGSDAFAIVYTGDVIDPSPGNAANSIFTGTLAEIIFTGGSGVPSIVTGTSAPTLR